MKSSPAIIPASATPLLVKTREWDGVQLEFFVLTKWHRSHDRMVDGTRYYVPVAAAGRQVIWTGPRHDAEDVAAKAALEMAATIAGYE